ncbi:MotA/TolQ/ExbB proton channel family protein [Pyxidicoccus parkwayensis]|uniref:MotA/TolQ/ExbB proton channel family protein n=1 Tax=Pyxidicoccus parkwayensis TaxID=2813578 RepID=A0ABX7NM05_9BACT|nr:MotA/TolQ/ExbB proton channel family protein [Pyxidicoccus parkwaysis]QSQ19461.1 MotA/TolQ/ExbB proton channel family protein [Pyxidicoccus parkwaysis]
MIEKLTYLMVGSGATWVLWLLIALSLASVAVALERAWAFRRMNGRMDQLVPELRKLLRGEEYERARKLLEGADSVESRVVAAGLAELEQGAASAEEAMAAAMGLERKRLEQRLLFLGTVGNNAPFVGLLGTVIGVVGAFEALGHTQPVNGAMAAASALAPERIMGAISEALVATAVGLVVAIPAVAAFNYFQGRVTAALADAETLGHVLLAHLREEQDPRGASRQGVQREAPSHQAQGNGAASLATAVE